MADVSKDNFGPLIAYIVPGATALAGFSLFIPELKLWFDSSSPDSPTIGGFLYLTVASIAAGMTISAIRWAIVDTIHAWTGLVPPRLDFAKLGRNVEAYTLLIEIHYKHYQFYANMAVATAIAYACYRIYAGLFGHYGWTDVGVVVLEAIFLSTSRDTLRKYYERGSQVLSANSKLSQATPKEQSPTDPTPPDQSADGSGPDVSLLD